ncbi:hypothetical protein ACFL0F_01465 [Patescibacteria group bacterium]
MGRNNDNKKSKDKAKTSNEYKIQEKENWLDEHGHPSNKFLQSLADNNDMEKLRSIASDLDADYGPGESAEELISAIRSATRSNPNTTT